MKLYRGKSLKFVRSFVCLFVSLFVFFCLRNRVFKDYSAQNASNTYNMQTSTQLARASIPLVVQLCKPRVSSYDVTKGHPWFATAWAGQEGGGSENAVRPVARWWREVDGGGVAPEVRGTLSVGGGSGGAPCGRGVRWSVRRMPWRAEGRSPPVGAERWAPGMQWASRWGRPAETVRGGRAQVRRTDTTVG